MLLAFFLVSVRENGVKSASDLTRSRGINSNERVSLRPVFELLSSTVAWVWPALVRWLFVRRDQGSRPGSPAQGRPLLNAGSIVVRMAARDCAGIFFYAGGARTSEHGKIAPNPIGSPAAISGQPADRRAQMFA
jgi:hypothetical protein